MNRDDEDDAARVPAGRIRTALLQTSLSLGAELAAIGVEDAQVQLDFARCRADFDARVGPVRHWDGVLRATDCYLGGAPTAARREPPVEATLFLLVRDRALHVLNVLDPCRAGDVLPVLPWTKLLDLDPGTTYRASWALVGTGPIAPGATPPASTIVEVLPRSMAGFAWPDVVAVRLPLEALTWLAEDAP